MYEMQTFDTIMKRMLDRITEDIDKREGSVIYNALAPAAMELSQMYTELDTVTLNTFPMTCDRDFLIQFAKAKGMKPIAATPAVVKLITEPAYIEIQLGAVMSIGEFNYIVTSKIADGEYEATCDTPGIAGGEITGEMIVVPVEDISGLESIYCGGVLDAGTDEESTEHLRSRYINSLQPYAFGGNVADYKAKTLSVDGVGATRVFRAGEEFNGELIPGGYVEVCILDSQLEAASQSLITKVQDTLDPDPGTGKGLAPIGHVVTVSTVNFADITISMEIDASVQDYDAAVIRSEIERYFISLRKFWETSKGGLIVRRSNIEDVVYALPIVNDCQVTELRITGGSDVSHNLTLSINQLPRLDVLNITPSNREG